MVVDWARVLVDFCLVFDANGSNYKKMWITDIYRLHNHAVSESAI